MPRRRYAAEASYLLRNFTRRALFSRACEYRLRSRLKWPGSAAPYLPEQITFLFFRVKGRREPLGRLFFGIQVKFLRLIMYAKRVSVLMAK